VQIRNAPDGHMADEEPARPLFACRSRRFAASTRPPERAQGVVRTYVLRLVRGRHVQGAVLGQPDAGRSCNDDREVERESLAGVARQWAGTAADPLIWEQHQPRIAARKKHCVRFLGKPWAADAAATRPDAVEDPILGLVEWVSRNEHTDLETLDARHASCPRFPVWEDATGRGLVAMYDPNGHLVVRASSVGLTLLKEKRPHVHGELALARGPRIGAA